MGELVNDKLPIRWSGEKLVACTHSGRFHGDEIHAAGVLAARGMVNEFRRSRDPAVLATCDLRFDVGYMYDSATMDFDHHQDGGAGVRDNGVPYASAGLIWAHFGHELCNDDAEVHAEVDRILFQPIDARDVGYDKHIKAGQGLVYGISDDIRRRNPPPFSDVNSDAVFLEVVEEARRRIVAEVALVTTDLRIIPPYIERMLAVADTPGLLVLDIAYDWPKVMQKYAPNISVIVFPSEDESGWRVQSVNLQKRPLPRLWAGKNGADMVKASGVADAQFCNAKGYLASAQSMEGAVALAEIVLRI
ncbi:MAG: MYG1 family protein [Patescibacteria group bacterium]